jgi:hypothetical protein
MKISIKGLDKSAVLAALYNNSKPQGLGFLHYEETPMSITDATAIIGQQGYCYDYLKGRVMKVDISNDEFDPWLYDRDNGEGTAYKAIMNVILDN